MDEVKAHVEAALAALENELANEANAGLQVVKDKLVDVRDFLASVGQPTTEETPESTPDANAPAAEAPGQVPAPEAEPPVETPAEEAAPADQAETAESPVTDEAGNPIVDPNAAR